MSLSSLFYITSSNVPLPLVFVCLFVAHRGCRRLEQFGDHGSRMSSACALCCRKAPIGVERDASSCSTIHVTRFLAFDDVVCSLLLQLGVGVWVFGCKTLRQTLAPSVSVQ